MPHQPARARAEPVGPDQRIVLLDILRGFALSGVLLVNMMSYGAYDSGWSGPVDKGFRFVEFFFFEHRFWHLFSLLFGLGFAMQWSRAQAGGVRFVPLYLRRLLVLFFFGAVSNVLWRVDILTDYAVLGLLLLPMRRFSARVILVAAVLTQLAPPLVLLARSAQHVGDEASWSVPGGAVEVSTWAREEHRLRSEGTFPEVVAGQARRYVHELLNPGLQPSLGNWWGYLAMFLLGLYAGKRRLLEDYHSNRELLGRVATVGLGVGLSGVGLAAWQAFSDPSHGQLPLLFRVPAEALQLLGYTGMMCFYAWAVARWSTVRPSAWLVRGFAAVGRTALSNYLLQACLINVVFMGWGFGLYQRLGPTATMLLSVPLYLSLMVVSVWWLGRYRYGPAEWLWRSLTYRGMQPMRVRSASANHDRLREG